MATEASAADVSAKVVKRIVSEVREVVIGGECLCIGMQALGWRVELSECSDR